MAKPDIPIEKFDGRLRAICRSSLTVNAKRADMCGGIATAIPTLEKGVLESIREYPDDDSHKKSEKSDGDIDAVVDEIEIQAYGYLADDRSEFTHPSLQARRGRLITLRGSPAEISEAAKSNALSFIQRSPTIPKPTTRNNGLSLRTTHPAPIPARLRNAVDTKKVLIGIIDTGGYDFAHPDFMRDGETRFQAIWDQGGDLCDPPILKNRKNGNHGKMYGSEITHTQMQVAIEQASQPGGFEATEFMAQSQMHRGSHATHVASIAAGNHSFAKDSGIVGVLISLPDEDWESRKSFYDTTRIVDAVDYLADYAETHGYPHLSINISLGTNGGPHDDSTPMNRWIDYSLTQAGRCVCVAAGNAGQEAGTNANDMGYVLGRIHTSGKIAATGLEHELEWVVVGNGREDISENELEIWYAPQDRISVQVKPPGDKWMDPIAPRQFRQNIKIKDGTFVSIFNKIYDPGNGSNKISIHLAPFYTENYVKGIEPGIWRIRLIGTAIRDGQYHGWIERDDPVHRRNSGGKEFWQFPSFFSEKSNVDNSSISTLACGDRVIAVANYDQEQSRENISSSQGPTRDGRDKPDIAAPGTDIWAANGFDPDVLWTAKTGTSMASPYITGLVAAMMANSEKHLLTSSQIMGIIRRTAKPKVGENYNWQNGTGFGVVDPRECIRQATHAGKMQDIDKKD